MAIIEWSDSFSVGNATIDSQHKKLFHLLDSIFVAMKAGKAKEIINPSIDELINYTETHFKTEEDLFEKHGYPDAVAHNREHKLFVDKVVGIAAKVKAGKMVLSVEITSFLKDWLVNHINGTDQKYAKFLIEKGEK